MKIARKFGKFPINLGITGEFHYIFEEGRIYRAERVGEGGTLLPSVSDTYKIISSCCNPLSLLISAINS